MAHPNWEDSGLISLGGFIALFHHLQDNQPGNDPSKEAFQLLDVGQKDYVTEQNFRSVMGSVAPKLADKRGGDLFHVADVYDAGKVTYSQFQGMMTEQVNA